MRRIACAKCGALIIAAQWSEHIDERRVRNSWSCDECGYAFETEVYLAASSATVRQHEFLEEMASDD
jgi:RNase P subunit RPR2